MFLQATIKKLGLIAAINGYPNITAMIVRYMLPLIITIIISTGILFVFIPQIRVITIVAALFGILAIVAYPFSVSEKKKKDINNTIHLFITYAGTISTMKISRGLLFKRIAQKGVFGEISLISQRILFLSKKWNLGFAKTSRMMAKVIPSTILGDFFDRFAVMMDFGENIESFLLEEQTSVLDDYETEYKKSLETIRTLQDVFISLSMALSFGVAIGLLLPLLMGTSIEYVIAIAIVAVVFIDIAMIIVIKAVIPDDPLFHDLDVKCKGIKQLEILAVILIPSSIILFLLFWLIFDWNFMFSVSLSIIPLFILGLRGKTEEDYVFRRDSTFSSFVRTLGSATEIRSGALVTALSSLRIHDFALINEMVVNLYKRLKIGSEKYKSWKLFAAETGSNLIFHFSRIFAESIYLGGNARKIGEIISNNFQRLLSLRKLKLQQAAGLRGASYGSLIGLATVTFVSLEIVQLLSSIFGDSTLSSGEFSVASILGSGNFAIDLVQSTIAIGIMIICHSFLSSVLLKIIDGGTYYSIFFDFVLMVWIGSLVSWIIPGMVGDMLPNMSLGSGQGAASTPQSFS